MDSNVMEMKIMEHDDKLINHDGRIQGLEKADVKHTDKIGELCEKIEKLCDTQNKIFYAMILGMAGILCKYLFKF